MLDFSFDIQRARRETPGCANRIHFNNAGASLMPAPVVEAIINHHWLEAEIGGYEAAERKGDEVKQIYQLGGALLGAAAEEIAIVENATRAWDMAFHSIPFKKGDRILTSAVEYGSNFIAFLQTARRTGATIHVIPNDEYGQVSLEALRNMLDARVVLVAITHIPTNGGLVNPAPEIGKLVRDSGALYLLDACQSIGQIPIDVREIGCDILSATGRKYLRGPRGTGLLYVGRHLIEDLEPPFLDVRSARWISRDRYEMKPDARRFENWETNYATKIGLGVAIEYALAWGIEVINDRVSTLACDLRSMLEKIPGVTVLDLGRVKCGIVSFTLKGISPTAVKSQLAVQRINVSVSIRRDTLIDMEARGLEEVVRASVHYYNTDSEVEQFCEAIAKLSY